MKRAIPILAAIVVIGIAIYLVARPRPASGDWVEGSGVIEATEVDVGPLVGGKLERIPVEQGEWVNRGQLLAELDPRDIEPQVTQARGAAEAAEAALAQSGALLAGARLAAGNAREAHRKSTELKGQYEAARARHEAAKAARSQARAALDLVRAGARPEQVEQARAAVASAQVGFDNAQRELTRLEELQRRGAVAQQQVDLHRSARDGAQTALDAARARLAEVEAGARSEERRQAEAALAQAEANVEAAAQTLAAARDLYRDRLVLKQQLDSAEAQYQAAQQAQAAAAGQAASARGSLAAAEKRLADTRVLSPMDGVVTIKIREAGETVVPGQAVVRLADLDHMWLRVDVPITQLDRVKLGQEAEVTIDAAPGKVFRGHVIEIGQQAEFTPKNVQTQAQRVKLVFAVKVQVENPNRELKPGMPADARIRAGPRR